MRFLFISIIKILHTSTCSLWRSHTNLQTCALLYFCDSFFATKVGWRISFLKSYSDGVEEKNVCQLLHSDAGKQDTRQPMHAHSPCSSSKRTVCFAHSFPIPCCSITKLCPFPTKLKNVNRILYTTVGDDGVLQDPVGLRALSILRIKQYLHQKHVDAFWGGIVNVVGQE